MTADSSSPAPVADGDAGIDWSFAGPRVACRLVDARDRELYRALYTSPEVMAEIGPAMSVDQADATLARACGHNVRPPATALARYWLIARTTTGASAGIVSMVRKPDDARCGMLGVMLLPEWQNRGVGLPGLAGVVAGVFSPRWPLGIDVLLGYHALSNPNSGRLTEGLGFARMPDEGDQGVWRLERAEWPGCLERWPRSMRAYASTSA